MINNQRRVWARFLHILQLFFESEGRWPAIVWFTLLLTLLLSLSGLNVVNSYVGRDFMTAISDRRWNQFVRYAFIYTGVFAVSTVMSAFYRFSEERLRLLWRAWMTRLLIDRYMARDAFYRLKARDEVDNPDERITEDVKSYTQTTLSFLLMSLNALITSLAFLGVLWSITPWLVVVAGLYAGAGTVLTILLGRPLVRLDNLQLQKEADLRYHLIQTRETAEAIAAMRAERTVGDCLRARLAEVVANNQLIIRVTRNLNFFVNGYNYLIQLIPLLIVAPMYINGHVEFGVVTQSAMAFSAFLGAFSLIVTQFETLSSFAAVTARLDTISQAIDQAQSPAVSGIRVVEEPDRVAFDGLTLWTPRGPPTADPGTLVRNPLRPPTLDHRAGCDCRDGPVPGDVGDLGGWGGAHRPARTGEDRLRAQATIDRALHFAIPVDWHLFRAIFSRRSHPRGAGEGRPRFDGEPSRWTRCRRTQSQCPLSRRAAVVGLRPGVAHVPPIRVPGSRWPGLGRRSGRDALPPARGIRDQLPEHWRPPEPAPYHDMELEIQGDGRWQFHPLPARDGGDGPVSERSTSTSTSTPTPSGARQ